MRLMANLNNILRSGILLAFALPFGASGQPIDTATFIHTPDITIQEAKRFETRPQLEVPEIPKPVLDYSVKLEPAAVAPSVEVPNPEKMAKSDLPKYTSNYIKLGFGNYTTPLADIYFSSPRNSNYLIGADYHHLSSKGPEFADFNSNSASLFGKRLFRKGTLDGSFMWNREDLHFYGYDTSELKNVTQDSLKQFYQTFEGRTAYEFLSIGKNKDYLRIHASFYTIGDRFKQSENNLDVGAFSRFKIQKHEIEAGLSFNNQDFEGDTNTFRRNFIHLTPAYILKTKQYKLRLGFVSTLIVPTGSNSLFYFFPDVEGEYQVEDGNLSVFAKFTGNVQKNSFRGFAMQNPYLALNPDLANTINRFGLTAGIRGKLSNTFGVAARILYNRYDDLPLFMVDSFPERRFRIIHDDAKLIRFNLELNYLKGEKVRSSLVFNYYSYTMVAQSRPWLLPNLDLKWNNTYNLGDKLLFSLDLFLTGKRYSAIYGKDAVTELQPFVDINVGVDYRWRKNVSAFIKLNNLAAQRYQYWTNYPVYGFNAVGGIAIGL